jgi:hypothetical protein
MTQNGLGIQGMPLKSRPKATTEMSEFDTDWNVGAGSPPLSPLLAVEDQSLRIPKNKSTGHLAPLKSNDDTSDASRSRFSFDAGTAQELNNLKRWVE